MLKAKIVGFLCFEVNYRNDFHLDLGASGGRPAFLICVEVFGEQTTDEGTKETNYRMNCFQYVFVLRVANI